MPRALVQVSNANGVWVNVKGILDSGSATTVGSLQHHKHLFVETQPVRNIVKIQLINKQQLLAKEIGRINIRVIDSNQVKHEFNRPALVFLVDSPEWEELIIGIQP
ncbi:MAG: hypothetical protein MI921_21460 [Cytophagales bacterium]|nr:hypothetical protein [Cytophagales bacterium]